MRIHPNLFDRADRTPPDEDEMAGSKRPRIADVAKLAGVSEAAVSVVLNNRVGERVRVSEEKQRQIWEAARKLGYVANPVAQNLAGGQTRIVAVFTFEAIFPIDSRNFYYPFLIGIEEEADALGYDLLLVTGSNGSEDGTRRIYQKGFNRLRRADGAILLGHAVRSEVERLIEESYPFVFVGRRESAGDAISYVAADYTTASAELVQHLIAHGHQRIAYIRTLRNDEASHDREIGVRRVLGRTSDERSPAWLWQGRPEALTADVIAGYVDEGYTAFVVEDDELGIRLLAHAEQIGLHCPADYSLVVLTNSLNPLIEVPDWTSFNIPRREMGREAFRMLIDLLELPVTERVKPLRKTLNCTFKPGNSVRSL